MNIVVLGAGLIGTASAWYLARQGHAVTVVDRQPLPGNETSFANGGQISVSHAEPWANPHVLPHLLRWLGREDAPLYWRWQADPAQILWGARFLRECLPGATRRNINAIVSLALDSRSRLKTLRAELGLEYDQQARGILHLYTDPQEYAAALRAAAVMREFGADRVAVDAARCVDIEPALADVVDRLVGGDYMAEDESGDAHRFTNLLARHAVQAGVEFRFSTRIDRLAGSGRRVAGAVVVPDGGEPELLTADAYVVALGSFSPALVAPLGCCLPVYPAKGYSATVDLVPGTPAPVVSLTDDGRKLVYSRLGDRLRIAGTAEFNGYNLDLNPVRCEALIARTRELFPRLEWTGAPRFWCGLRPATPSNVPIIGRARRLDNLWFNTGHGTLGWTLACGSGAALADLMSGQRPGLEFPFAGC